MIFDLEFEVGEEWSLDGCFVSFVCDYDLYVVDLVLGWECVFIDGGSMELYFGCFD